MLRLYYDALKYVEEHGNARAKLRVWVALGRTASREAQRAADELAAQQNEDGGWPWRMEAGLPSSVIDTTRTVEALVGAGLAAEHPALERAGAFLLSLQRIDGGWSEHVALRNHIPWDWEWYSVEHSSPSTTGQALYALYLLGHKKDKAVKRGLRFLRRAQTSDGGWLAHVGPTYPYGIDWASMFQVIRALRSWEDPTRVQPIVDRAIAAIDSHRECWSTPVDNPLDTFLLLGYSLDHPDVQETLENLVKTQRPDGGWNWFGDLQSSPSQTANWIVALAGAGFDLAPAGRR
ncbi:MAG: terpene cyclase/mutase family protein [Chloroflexi bacterium]|nr:terpene cyclase/mutase family protein [Chloroflexota bacterium]MBU1748864.1 terpene cyclase/mutase family protein [Chloroflexota bacterium]MBU1880177.1 terpene cyclase/mutase family protein [Chloroflexota bacterium]